MGVLPQQSNNLGALQNIQAQQPSVMQAGPPTGQPGYQNLGDPSMDKWESLLMAGARMMEAGGQPGATGLSGIGAGIGADVQNMRQLQQQRLAQEQLKQKNELDMLLRKSQLARATMPNIKVYQAGGKTYQYDANSPKPDFKEIEGVGGKSTGAFMTMLDNVNMPQAEKDKLRTEWLKNQASGKAGSPTINLGDSKAWQAVQSKYYSATRDQASSAQSLLGTVDRMREALGKVSTGATQPIIHPFVAIAKDLGVSQETLQGIGDDLGLNINDVAGVQNLDRLTKSLGLVMAQALLKGQGTVTNEERRQVTALAAQMGTDARANEKAMNDIETWGKNRIDKFKSMSKWKDVKGQENLEGFDTYWMDELGKRRDSLKSPIKIIADDMSDEEITGLIKQYGRKKAMSMIGLK